MLQLVNRVLESIIDFPQRDLDSQIWAKTPDGQYVLREDVKKAIMDYIKSYPDFNLLDAIKELHIVGSITTNLYGDTADIDVHIVPDESKIPGDKEEFAKKVKKWSHRNPVYIGKHPIELYVQLNPYQDLLSDGCYDVLKDTWIKGPRIVDLDYNPYQVFKDVMDKVREYARQADIDLGELKRDVIDYQVIKNALSRLPTEYKEQLKAELEGKLQEIEDDIRQLLRDKKLWVELRHQASQPKSPGEALEDVLASKRWQDANATFKFLDRYGYIKLITMLEELLEDDKLEHSEVDVVKRIVLGSKASPGQKEGGAEL